MLIELALVKSVQQQRGHRELNQTKIKRYARWMVNGKQAPPIKVLKQYGLFYVQDGHHRVAAARLANLKTIEAEVTDLLYWGEL